MKRIDKNKPVMVTGATGYVAGWIIKKLLEDGVNVHAAVRDPQNEDKLKYLKGIAENAKGSIRFFKADLLEEGSYKTAMEDCEVVFHTASPFINSVKDPQRDLIDPALKGTQNVLQSVNKTESVKRVVLTSSVAAIMGDTKDLLALPNQTANESHWNQTSNIKHQAYSYSKTLAEKEAWHINEQQSRWDLVTINPTLVLGPGISPLNTSESFNIMKQIGDGTLKSGAPGLDIGIVDVRNVADAHINAAFKPEAEGRHIVSADHKSILEVAEILREKYGTAYPFPKNELPKFLAWLVGPMFGIKRKMVSNNFGYPWLVDNSKSRTALGIEYMPVETTVTEFFQQMVDHGVFEKK